MAIPTSVPSSMAPGHQREDRKPNEEFEIGTEDVFQSYRLLGHVISAKPLDVSAGGPDEHRVNQTRKWDRDRERPPPGKPDH